LDWETLYAFTSKADEPKEGRELDWEEAEAHGEKVIPKTDMERPLAPRAPLRRFPVVEGSVSVAAAPDYLALEVIDVTEVPSWGVPSRDEAYVDRKGGAEADRVYVYVNPSRKGEEIYVQYEYYPSGEDPRVCVSGDATYWTGPETGKWFVYEEGQVSRGYNAPPLHDVLSAADDGIYAAGPDLYVHSRRRSRVLSAFPNGVKPKEVLGYLAQAWDVVVDYTDNRVFRFGMEASVSHVIGTGEIIGFATTDRQRGVPSVEMNYAGGRIRNGEGRETVVYRNPYVDTVEHAEWVADRLRKRYEGERSLFELTVAGIKDVQPGDTVEFEIGKSGVKRKGVVKKARIDFETNATAIEMALGGGYKEGEWQGFNTFPAE
jgi:hypothetical protein